MLTEGRRRPQDMVPASADALAIPGIDHGTAKAAMRTDCTCKKCNAKRAKMMRRGTYWR